MIVFADTRSRAMSAGASEMTVDLSYAIENRWSCRRAKHVDGEPLTSFTNVEMRTARFSALPSFCVECKLGDPTEGGNSAWNPCVHCGLCKECGCLHEERT